MRAARFLKRITEYNIRRYLSLGVPQQVLPDEEI